jgi:acyl carrier protein
MEEHVSLEEIEQLVGLILGYKNVGESDKIVEDLRAESADLLNILATIEEKYMVTITDSAAAKIFTPADLYYLVNRQLSHPR